MPTPCRILVFLLAATMIGITLLHLRQRRAVLSHRAVVAHERIDRARHVLWREQARVNQNLEFGRLRDRIRRSALALEPAFPATVHPLDSLAAGPPARRPAAR